MPTKHRRIAVVVDPELSQKLDEAASALPGRSSAALLRDLAVIGAESLRKPDRTSTKLDRLLARPEVRPSAGGLEDYLANSPDMTVPAGSDPYSGTKALDEQRQEHL